MTDKNTPYRDIWANWGEMGLEQRKAIGSQMLQFVVGASPLGVVEILENAPLNFKRVAWKVWVEKADLSGYLFKDIIGLQTTETAEITHEIVNAWRAQANLARSTDEQISKMADSLTTFEDRCDLWARWIDAADLRVYKLADVIGLMEKMLDKLPEKMFAQWLRQGGQVRNAPAKLIDRAEKLGPGVIELWNNALS